MSLALSALIILAAAWALFRKVEVRLVLILAALALSVLAGQLDALLRTFLHALADEKFVVPICCAMGFAHVLKLTQCDTHLVLLLTKPLRRVRVLLVPGTVLAGVLVNVPIISQTSTALTLGAVLVPVLRAAGVPLPTIGAALLLGSSIGGELLNPGAPELATIAKVVSDRFEQPLSAADCVGRVAPLLLLHLAVAVPLFTWLTWRRAEPAPAEPQAEPEATPAIRYDKAALPLLPLALLFLVGPPLNLFTVPESWLLSPDSHGTYGARLIGAAMLVGVAAAALTDRQAASRTMVSFFEGAGYAYAHIISLIVVGTCFGKSVELSGLAAELGALITRFPALLVPAAAALPLTFAALSGSGIGATNSLYGFFAEPCRALDADPVLIGVVVALASAAGRTMSAVAAVALMCASLTQTTSLDLVRRVAVPLLAGMTAVTLVAMFLVHG
ncbi:MAG TPA: C4-dicarboxylate transporter DcuC [Gemmatales bacterium]|nr:C4-dicarboxylate transporter DcuC [Gemmatales bacterium]